MGKGALAHVVAVAALLASAAPAAAERVPAMPIPESPSDDVPTFTGSPASPKPLDRLDVPRHPFMARDGDSNIHNDAYMSDTYNRSGPLGRRTTRTSTYRAPGADCASVTFDTRGRVVTICVGLLRSQLVLMHPRTLDELARFDLPPRQPGLGNPFTDFTGGGYFYLDHKDRAVIPTTTRHILVVAEGRGPSFELRRDYDVTGAVEQGDSIVSTLPDFDGLIWFVSTRGVVGTVDPRSGRVRALKLPGEGITNSFSVDEDGGVYIASDRALYRFKSGRRDRPKIIWRKRYPNTGEQKPGQVDDGSGTTPTVMGSRYVAITDNADPMNVVVYRRAPRVDGGRRVCSQPVFERGRSATDNSLIATERSLVVENNYGYEGPASTTNGGVTAPGVERVDLDRDGRGCTTKWKSDVISPTVVPKLSLDNGLVYVYTKNRHPDDPWYLTALSFRSGKTVFKRLAGTGLGFNNNYAPVSIGPDGTAYVGVLGGLVALRDSAKPSRESSGGFTRHRPPAR